MIKSCLARVGCLTVLAVALAAVWFFRDDVSRLWTRLEMGEASPPSEELARSAESKIRGLGDGTQSGRIRLSQAELQSLLTYRVAAALPPGIVDPVVEVRDSSVLVSAGLRREELEGQAPAEILQQFVTDSTRVTAELIPDVLRPGVARVRVAALQAGAVVIPSLMVPWILDGVDMPRGIESSGSALLMPLPPAVRSLELRPGEIVLLTEDGGGPDR